MVAYGGFKDFLGNDKVWMANLVLYPNGQIPTLVDGGFVLQEPNAILYYRAEGTPYLPQEPQTKE